MQPQAQADRNPASPFEVVSGLDLVRVHSMTLVARGVPVYHCQPLTTILGPVREGPRSLRFEFPKGAPGLGVAMGDSLLVPRGKGILRSERTFKTTSDYFRVDHGYLPCFNVSLDRVATQFEATRDGFTLRPMAEAEGSLVPGVHDYVYVVELPEVITKVRPEYPAAARGSKLEGTVILKALVGVDGVVKETSVIRSVAGFDDAASDCVRKWKFRPAMSNGKPVEEWVTVPVKFIPE